ncbi:MAG: formate hydrogenlyase subunit 4 [Candidatus Infernicultor aquiphilus]|uniref:NADH dehydrogenase n=2 Tax=Candidatus Infernicultor aquiphilus TaxID=1805029 RepID=A0A1J5GIP2_9BACT|nr:MAG: NADH dehydrogenase [Candidatus Atribacteria bacterium CG2_30_33_13]PIW11664.1 MAG: formate hydrogenlyase subunit 4 [Candidatus Atribacteria bacterium CG17_big_fil_post_rev_8_21_14_2_50_34_11]
MNDLVLLLLKIIGAIIIAFLGVVIGLFYKGIDRKLAARMQARVGPPLRQPFLDFFKLMIKENIVPENAVPWIFNGVPIMTLVSSISILFYLPISNISPLLSGYGDIILIIYLLTLPAVGMVVGGFVSGSPYANIGAQREMVMMMSYELPLVTTVVALGWKLSKVYPQLNVFSLAIINAHPIWGLVGPLGFVGAILLLITLAIVTPGELSKIPFDVPEAETELAGGLLVEYSGRNLAIFSLADAVKTIVMTSLTVVLFFPYNLSPLFALSGVFALIIDLLFFLVKLLLAMFMEVTFIRVVVARLKIDQVSYAYWVPLSLIGLLGLALIALDTIIV